MPLSAQQLKAVHDRIRAGDVSQAQGMLLDLEHTAAQEELAAQIEAGNPPPPPTTQESLLALLTAIVTHLGSPPVMLQHLTAIAAAKPDSPAIAESGAPAPPQPPANAEGVESSAQ